MIFLLIDVIVLTVFFFLILLWQLYDSEGIPIDICRTEFHAV